MTPDAGTVRRRGVLRPVERLVFDSRAPWWVAGVMLLAVAKSGVSTTPIVGYWRTLAVAFPHRPPGLPHVADYLMGSPIGPAVAHIIGATGPVAYPALHAGVAAGAVAVTAVGLHRRGGRPAVAVGVAALLASALSSVLPQWLGMQDPFTVAFTSLAVLFDNPLLLVVAGAGLALSHLPIGALVVATAVVGRTLERRQGRSVEVGCLLVGFGVAAAATLLHEVATGSIGGEERFLRLVGYHTVLVDWAGDPMALVFSFYGVWWAFLLLTWRVLRRGQKLLLAASLACGVAATLMSLDETRVFALATWPAVLFASVWATQASDLRRLRTITAAVVVAAVVVPRTWIEGGAVVGSSWLTVLRGH